MKQYRYTGVKPVLPKVAKITEDRSIDDLRHRLAHTSAVIEAQERSIRRLNAELLVLREAVNKQLR